MAWQSAWRLSMPGLIVRKKIVPLNAKIEGSYIRLGARSPCAGPQCRPPMHAPSRADRDFRYFADAAGARRNRCSFTRHNPAVVRPAPFRRPGAGNPRSSLLLHKYFRSSELWRARAHRNMIVGSLRAKRNEPDRRSASRSFTGGMRWRPRIIANGWRIPL
jgi:hypothetical protein